MKTIEQLENELAAAETALKAAEAAETALKSAWAARDDARDDARVAWASRAARDTAWTTALKSAWAAWTTARAARAALEKAKREGGA